MAAAKLLTNMSSSMNSLEPWGWTNPIFSRDIHGFHVQIKRLPLFHLPSPMPSHTLAIPCHWPGKSWSKARLLSFLLSQHLGNLLWGWLLFPGWRSGHWARSHTAAEAHGKFLSPYALFCFVFPFFLSFYSFVSYHEIVCVKKILRYTIFIPVTAGAGDWQWTGVLLAIIKAPCWLLSLLLKLDYTEPTFHSFFS